MITVFQILTNIALSTPERTLIVRGEWPLIGHHYRLKGEGQPRHNKYAPEPNGLYSWELLDNVPRNLSLFSLLTQNSFVFKTTPDLLEPTPRRTSKVKASSWTA